MTIQSHDWRSARALKPASCGDCDSLTRGVLPALRRLWRAYLRYQARRALRLTLRSLDERTLRDIGLSHAEIAYAPKEAGDRQVWPDLGVFG